MAFRQKGLTIDGTPSRIRLRVMGSKRMSDASGTCLTQTTMCNESRPFAGILEFDLGVVYNVSF